MEKTGVYVSNKHRDSMIHSLSLGFSIGIKKKEKKKDFRGESTAQKMTLNINL